MASTLVNQTQEIGSTVIDTGLSLFEKIYNNPFVHGLVALLIALALSGLLIFLSRIISIFIRNRISRNFVMKEGVAVKKMGVLMGDIVFYCMSFLSIYISFNVVGIDIGLLMGGITIGVGFAFRQTLSNMISGIVIFSTEEYKLGNIVQLKMAGDIFGVIEEINMKNVIIRSFDMRRIIIPNASFLKKAVKTYNSEDFLRLEAEVVVDVNLDINFVIQQTFLVVNSYDFILNKQYTQVLLDSFDDKKAKLKVQFFFNPNAGYAAEYIKSAVQIQLLDLYKKLSKTPKITENKSLEKAPESVVKV